MQRTQEATDVRRWNTDNVDKEYSVNTETMDRRWIILGAILIQLCLGAIYAWSVFTAPLKDAGWSVADTQYVFTAGLVSFAVVMVLAGRIMPRFGPRRLAVAGGVVLGSGYLLASMQGGTAFWPVFLGVGIVGGAGIGLAYVVPIAVGMRWFPDRKGLITGLAVAGFGFGAMLWVKLAGAWGNLIGSLGLGATFAIYGVVFVCVVVVGGVWMVYPPEGWRPTGYSPSQGGSTTADHEGFTSGEMLRTLPYYLILLTFAISASAGLMTIGLMKLFPMQALMASGMERAAASAVAGTAMAVFFSLANGIGRIVWGALSDRIGRKAAIMLMMASQGVVVILFQFMAGSEYLLYLAATIIGFNFGGNFALFPTVTADTFGAKHIGQNYGWVFLAYGLGGILGPMLGGKLGDLNNYPLAFTICGTLCFVALGMIAPLQKPERRAPRADTADSGVTSVALLRPREARKNKAA